MKFLTWTARHDYYNNTASGVTHSYSAELEAYAATHLSPDQFLRGRRTGRKTIDVIALPDKRRADGERQMHLAEIRGPLAIGEAASVCV